MQGDNARTIDDQVVPDEEAKLLLALSLIHILYLHAYDRTAGPCVKAIRDYAAGRAGL